MAKSVVEQELLQGAVEACMATVGARLKMMFSMGETVLELEAHYRTRVMAKDGNSRRQAINRVRNHVTKHADRLGYSVPQSESYWYVAVDAVVRLSRKERRQLIEMCVPWTEMPHLLALGAGTGQYIKDQITAGQWKTLKPRKRTRAHDRDPHSAEPELCAGPNTLVVPLPNAGDDESMERFQAAIDCLQTRIQQERLCAALNNTVQRVKLPKRWRLE